MTLFFAVCVGASFLLRVPVWKKILLIISAVPIAIISNVVRIVLTGVLTEWVNADVGNFIHDKAGWLMMPLAMLMIWGEMSLLSALLIETLIEGLFRLANGEILSGGKVPWLVRVPGPRPDKPPGSPRA